MYIIKKKELKIKNNRIIVIGGNAAGPAAAAKAKRTNPSSEVILLEAGEFISTGSCEIPYLFNNIISDYKNIIFYDEKSFFEDKNVVVKTNSLVKFIDRKQKKLLVYSSKENKNYELEYDKLILTTGSYVPDIPELILKYSNFSKIKSVKDYIYISNYFKNNKIEKVLIIGGGYTGLEIADTISSLGVKVIIYEKREVFANYNEEIKTYIKTLIKQKQIELIENAEKVIFINKDDKITNYKIEGKIIPVDFVIQATGVKPNNFLAESAGLSIGKFGGLKVDNKLKTTDPNIYAAGDNIEVTEHITGKPIYYPLATVARNFGHIAGENAAGGNKVVNPIIKNTTFIFHNKAFSFVGLNLNEIKTYGYNYKYVFASANSLVHVMPGSDKVHGYLYVNKNNGLILGAELWGEKVVANYADIISIYIRKKIKAIDLENEYFNYSPPLSPMINLLNIFGQKLKKEM